MNKRIWSRIKVTVPLLMIWIWMMGLLFMHSSVLSSAQKPHVPVFASESNSSAPAWFSWSSRKLQDIKTTIPFLSTSTKQAQIIPDLKVVPGGHTIGVRMKSSGAMVVGFHHVQTTPSIQISPAEQAKLTVGDLITHINQKPLSTIEHLSELIAEAGKSDATLQLTIQRDQEQLQLPLKPMYDIHEKTFQIGLYIRDSATGVGTLTFYAPDQHAYGALGHVITDMDTKLPIIVGQGEIVQSKVTSIAKSQHGEPGEKRAIFFKDSEVLGSIEKNTPFGIFGKMKATPAHSFRPERVPVALREEVQKGPAYIYTVIDGQQVQKFDIEIVQTSSQPRPATKGMIIKITDPRLLDKTGGIIQGMSGSPILQNGKIVGAVTHVFVNDPTSGYGCYIEWMLEDAGIKLRTEAEPQAS